MSWGICSRGQRLTSTMRGRVTRDTCAGVCGAVRNTCGADRNAPDIDEPGLVQDPRRTALARVQRAPRLFRKQQVVPLNQHNPCVWSDLNRVLRDTRTGRRRPLVDWRCTATQGGHDRRRVSRKGAFPAHRNGVARGVVERRDGHALARARPADGADERSAVEGPGGASPLVRLGVCGVCEQSVMLPASGGCAVAARARLSGIRHAVELVAPVVVSVHRQDDSHAFSGRTVDRRNDLG